MTTPVTIGQLQRARQAKDYRLLLAICTVCATTRSAKQPRNKNWKNETGELKCATCQTITRHALVHGGDRDEREHALALGMPDEYGNFDPRRMDAYDRSRTNPKLLHVWWTKDEKAARERGERFVRAFCGQMAKIPAGEVQSYTGPSKKPYGDTLDGRSYDPDDVGEWRRMSCVNCNRVENHLEAVRRRKRLAELMTTALAELLDPLRANIFDGHSEALIAALENIHRPTTA